MSKPEKILIFGATSAIAYETGKLFAKEGASLYLCARDKRELERLADDLTVRGAAAVAYTPFDALDTDSIINAINKCLAKFPDLDSLLIAHGMLPDQKVCETNISEMKKVMDINFTSAAIILTHIASHLEKQGRGIIAAVSSAAGDRGRQSNYIYGAAKGGLTIYLSGLRQRLSKQGITVLTIKPGMVDTPMTVDFKKGLLFSRPDIVAKGIYNAMLSGKDVVYVPWFWRMIMFIIRNIPEKIFNKMKL